MGIKALWVDQDCFQTDENKLIPRLGMRVTLDNGRLIEFQNTEIMPWEPYSEADLFAYHDGRFVYLIYRRASRQAAVLEIWDFESEHWIINKAPDELGVLGIVFVPEEQIFWVTMTCAPGNPCDKSTGLVSLFLFQMKILWKSPTGLHII